MNPLITIVGPTAVGKTDLTLELAEQLHAEVISGDAYQVYKQLNIGPLNHSVDELNRVKHHLIRIYWNQMIHIRYLFFKIKLKK